MCIFKNLKVHSATMDTSAGLSKVEFEQLYECMGLKWELVCDHTQLSSDKLNSRNNSYNNRYTRQAVLLRGMRV